MGSHPINLAFRFLLELTALAVMGIWGWHFGADWTRFVFALVIPVFGTAIWVIFAVPNDPSRSGAAPVPVPGILRLVIELAIFACAIWMIYDLEYPLFSRLFGVAVVSHYLLSMDRILWLIQKNKREK